MGPGPAYPPYPLVLPPRKDNTLLIVVVVVVLILAIPMILAGVLYYMVSGITPPGPSGKPLVSLYLSTATSSSATIVVAGIQPVASPSNFKLNLEVGSSYGTAVSVSTPAGTAASIVVNLATYTVVWYNPAGSGEVSQGDQFDVSFPGGSGAPAPATPITFFLLWADGSIVSSISFSTPSSPPTVSLSTTKGSAGVDLLVTSVSSSYPPTDFLVNVENATAGVYGNATSMPTISGSSVTDTVGAGSWQTVFSITWQNPGATGTLSTGDHLVVRRVSGTYSAGTTFAFLLLWSDGSTLARVVWQV